MMRGLMELQTVPSGTQREETPRGGDATFTLPGDDAENAEDSSSTTQGAEVAEARESDEAASHGEDGNPGNIQAAQADRASGEERDEHGDDGRDAAHASVEARHEHGDDGRDAADASGMPASHRAAVAHTDLTASFREVWAAAARARDASAKGHLAGRTLLQVTAHLRGAGHRNGPSLGNAASGRATPSNPSTGSPADTTAETPTTEPPSARDAAAADHTAGRRESSVEQRAPKQAPIDGQDRTDVSRKKAGSKAGRNPTTSPSHPVDRAKALRAARSLRPTSGTEKAAESGGRLVSSQALRAPSDPNQVATHAAQNREALTGAIVDEVRRAMKPEEKRKPAPTDETDLAGTGQSEEASKAATRAPAAAPSVATVQAVSGAAAPTGVASGMEAQAMGLDPKISEALRDLHVRDTGETVIRLQNTDVGELEIRIRQEGDNLIVRVHTEEQALRQRLLESLPDVRARLDKANLVAGRVDIAQYGETEFDLQDSSARSQDEWDDGGASGSEDGGQGHQSPDEPRAPDASKPNTAVGRSADGRLHVIV